MVTDRPDALSVASSTSEDERRLRLIIEATPNAMLMVDRSGRIVLVNSQTEELFGYRREQLLEMGIDQLIPPRFRGHHRDYREGYFAEPSIRAMGAGRDLYGLRSDGTEVPIEIGLNPLETDEGTYVLAAIIDITDRKRSEERLLRVIEAAPNAMVMVNDRGAIVLVNSEAERSFGYRREELLEMSVVDLIPLRFRPQHSHFLAGFFANPSRREMGSGRELFGLRRDGTEIPIEIGLNPIQILDEHFVLASIIDISERLTAQKAENAIRQDRLRRSILDSLPFSIIATDLQGTIVTANPAAERLLGYRQSELVGSSLMDIHGDEPGLRDGDWPLSPASATGEERELVYRHRDGTRLPVNEAIAPIRGEDGETTGFLTVAYDITKRIEAQAEVHHMANHDGLTDLPNRHRLLHHLVGATAAARAAGSEVVVLMLDLDHFKRVNDSLGHHVGDELLLAVAARLRSWVRADDLVSRLGGDEFVIVFSDVEDGDDLQERVAELMELLIAPIDVHGHQLVVTVSMGGVRSPRDGGDPITLLKHADTAMYHAKSEGRNNFQWFRESLLEASNDRVALASALRQALGQGELSVVYQPQVDLVSGEVTGMEALARWHSPHHGAIAPDRFIPVAEDGGMIVQLGEWVLRRACEDAVAVGRRLGRPMRVAVNVSPRQFGSPRWLDSVVGALEDTGLDPTRLDLEITEGILMDDPDGVVDVLRSLRDLGIGIVADDFGTGYSSLAYLTRFPIDKIKIDRSFVASLVEDADAAIVDTIILMAHTLGMSVVAEGVETGAQERYLRDRSCDEAQGYRYSAGVPVDELVQTVLDIQDR